MLFERLLSKSIGSCKNRMDKAVQCHIDAYGESPEALTEVPGVVTLMGAFGDFCKGYCITGTGALGLRVAMSQRDDGIVKIYDATRKDKKQFTLSSIKYKKEDRWANFVKGVFSVLSDEGRMRNRGVNITLKGALLYCDRITNAVAITVGVLMALDKLWVLRLEKSEIIRLVYQASQKFSKVHARLRDILTLMYAENGKVLVFDLQSVTYKLVDYKFSDESSLYGMVLDPQVPPQLLREELEEKREDAHVCLKKLQALLPDEYGRKLRNYPIKDLKSHAITGLSEAERRICEYVLSECRCTERGMDALKKEDAMVFAKQLSMIFAGMRDVFEITCPEVDWLVKRAWETDGVYGASLISNGATGSIFLIVDGKGFERYSNILEEYKRIFGFEPQTRVFHPGGAARVVECAAK